jgi:hypothetical protein
MMGENWFDARVRKNAPKETPMITSIRSVTLLVFPAAAMLRGCAPPMPSPKTKAPVLF